MIEIIVCYIHQYCVEDSSCCSGWRLVSKEEKKKYKDECKNTKEDFYYNIYSNLMKSETYEGSWKVQFEQISSCRLIWNPELIHEELTKHYKKEPYVIKHTNSKIINSLLDHYQVNLIKFQLAWNLL